MYLCMYVCMYVCMFIQNGVMHISIYESREREREGGLDNCPYHSEVCSTYMIL